MIELSRTGFLKLKRISKDERDFLGCIKYFLFIVLIFTSSISGANDFYYKGFQAYLDHNYEQAKSHWLQGAKQGNAKSMFNLGLLHEQDKIASSDPIKAEEWFTLAGKSGYFAADYHLALRIITSNGDQQKAGSLLKRAADNGFLPALSYLNGGDASLFDDILNLSTSTQTLREIGSLEQENNFQENVNGENSSKDYLSESWILSKKPSYWTVQLLAFNDEQKVKEFIETNKLRDQAAYFIENPEGTGLYKLIYGAYETKEMADLARQNLSDTLLQHEPWLRSIESIQILIKAK